MTLKDVYMNTKKKQREICDFTRFLMRRRCYTNFIANFKKQLAPYGMEDLNSISEYLSMADHYNQRDFVMRGFIWSGSITREGEDFWRNVDFEWKRYLLEARCLTLKS